MAIIVSSGEVSSGVVVNDYDSMYVYSGGLADNTRVNYSACLYISSGGMAHSTFVANRGYTYALSGGTANHTVLSGGDRGADLIVSSGGVANYTSVMISGFFYLYGVANSTTMSTNLVGNCGVLRVYDGGIANDTDIIQGTVVVHDGGAANRVSLSSGTLQIDSTGVAKSVTMQNDATTLVYGYGSRMAAYGQANRHGGDIKIYSGGSADDIAVYQYGDVYSFSGGICNNVLVKYGGNLLLGYDDEYWGTNERASGLVGGTAKNIAVESGGSMAAYENGKITGMLMIASGAVVSAYSGSVIDFDISTVAPDNSVLVNNLSLIHGTPSYSLTVAAGLSSGTYYLAAGAVGFDKTITVNTATGEEIGVLTVGEKFVTADYIYRAEVSSSYVLSVKLTSTTDPQQKPTAQADITTPTNLNVTVTASFSDSSVKEEYSLDGESWLTYTAPIVMKDNGSVYFRGIDIAGNESEIAEYEVTNIDRVPPQKPTAGADIIAPTQKNVTVTATFSGDSAVKEYSLDKSAWKIYVKPVVMQDNGSVYFRGTDMAGNVSDVTEYKVSNIDRVPPAAPKASADIVKFTSDPVTVTATFSADTVKKEYSLDGEKWTAYTKGVTFTVNGKVFFRAADALGNVSLITEYDVNNIADGKTSFHGRLGYNGVYQESFTPALTESGWYTVSGDFGVFNGSLTICDNGRKVASGKIKNGVLNFNRNRVTLLDKAEPYTVVVKTTDKNRRASEFSFSINAYELFDKADNSDDDWKTAPAMAPGETLDNWVGYGDRIDWRALTTDNDGGVYGVFLSDVRERVKLTVYVKQNGGLKKVKSVTANRNKRTASISDLSVAPNAQYYVAVEAPGAKKAKNSDYKLEFTERAVFNWADNNWGDAVEIAETGGRTGALTNAAGGDRVDYSDLTGVNKLSFTMTDGKAKLTFYDANCQKVKLGSVRMADGSIRKNVSSLTLTNGNVVSDAVVLSNLDDSVKYLKVEAASKTLCAYTIA